MQAGKASWKVAVDSRSEGYPGRSAQPGPDAPDATQAHADGAEGDQPRKAQPGRGATNGLHHAVEGACILVGHGKHDAQRANQVDSSNYWRRDCERERDRASRITDFPAHEGRRLGTGPGERDRRPENHVREANTWGQCPSVNHGSRATAPPDRDAQASQKDEY